MPQFARLAGIADSYAERLFDYPEIGLDNRSDRCKLGYTQCISHDRAGGKMERARIFKSNKSQAVRLPKPVALPESVKQVDIVSLGRARLIAPAGEAWDSWFESEGATTDFMSTREQPVEQDREPF